MGENQRNSITVRAIDVLLGFGAGYGIYNTTDNLVYGLIVGIGFFFVLFFIKMKKEESNNN